MNTSDFKEGPDRTSKISKIKKGDKVIVNLISEPLQEQYNLLLQKREEMDELIERMKAIYTTPDQVPMEEAENIHTLGHEAKRIELDFWFSVNSQYKLWKIPAIGIRDGYCLVKMMGPDDFLKRLKQVFDEFSEEISE